MLKVVSDMLQTQQDAAIQSFLVMISDAFAQWYRIKIIHHVVSMLMLCGELQIF